MNTVIKVENISKQYKLGTIGAETIIQDVNRWWHRVRGKADTFVKIGQKDFSGNNINNEYLWALKDISFDVKQGEVLGIIGKNGAGKSTLLKILSQITTPTTGNIKIKGRIASLLEVGTGFHPELTGRENIFLNGAILGMTKSEIKKKFDEMVDFSGVEKYIDTPVKRYSSGMYVRLAFAVAAHLEPEILILDEVLSVGDAEFQKKCLGKMKDVSGAGRTVLFVSHNMAAISSLCNRLFILENGQAGYLGDVGKGIDHYLDYGDHSKGYADLQDKKSEMWKENKNFSRLLSIETLDKNNKRQSAFKMGSTLKIMVKFEMTNHQKNIELGIFIKGVRQEVLGMLSSASEGFNDFSTGIQEIEVEIPALLLLPSEYTIGVWIVHHREVDCACENAIVIDVVSDNLTGHFVDYDRFRGYGNFIRSKWSTQLTEAL
ncbi:MAG: ABC transporter ATP-binding protein [Bacteroidetes bacterium]|nr:ABC transporter ATP-binding protein [Bacteroidota bacterium]